MHMLKNNDKIRALIRLVLFALVFVVIFSCLEKHFFSESRIHPTWEYVADESHEPIDVLFVGNSHTYTTVDAELISKATGLNVRNLTCSSVNGEIVAANIDAFLNYEVPKVVVFEMCPFSVDNFEEMRSDKLGIVFEHFDGIPGIFSRIKAVSKVASFDDIPSGVFQLLRNTMMWNRWTDSEIDKWYDPYGAKRQYRVNYNIKYAPAVLSNYYSAPDDIEGMRMYPQNEEAFHDVLKLAKKYGFEIWIYNAPIDSSNRAYAAALAYIRELQSTYPSIKHIDDSMVCLEEIGIERTDYYDGGHLNPNGMEKISMWLGERIAERFSTDFSVDSLPMYKDTSVTMLENGKYRYEFNTFAEGQYRFVYKINGETIDTGFSAENWIEEEVIYPDEITSFIVYSRPNSLDAKDTDIRKYRFLPYTIEGYTVTIHNNILQIKNESNFEDDLSFAWYIINEETQKTDKYMYERSNFLEHTFTESGVYRVRAFTRAYAQQEQDEIRRGTEVLKVKYNAINNTLTILDSNDSVSIK